MKRAILIAGNWKMNHSQEETQRFFTDLQSIAPRFLPSSSSPQLQALIFPPFLSLERAGKLARECALPISVGAQNAHWEKKGAFTGEISGAMLKELEIPWVLIGHSERRQYFGETDETVRKRTESLLAQGFKVMTCIGETRSEREAGKTSEVLIRQLDGALAQSKDGITPFLNGRLVLAYEPVWAIGTGLTATPAQAEEAHQIIRQFLETRFGKEAAQRTLILYGGSVTPENVDSLLACPNVDGALVGGASLKAESFLSLLSAGARALKA